MGESGERALSVRLHEKCEHKEEHWSRKKCGHVWCKMCGGHVHPATRVSLKGAVGVVRNNSNWHKLDHYQYLFRENNAGSARLTKCMKEALGSARVAPPEDILYDK